MKRALITGVSGFAGSFLASYLLDSHNYSLTGTYLSDSGFRNLDEAVKKNINLVRVDLMNQDEVSRLVEQSRPEVVFHLAALASPAESVNDPGVTMSQNISGQLHLLEAIRKSDLLSTRIIIVSSADIYGLIKPEDLPVDEDTPLRPTNPYGVSKITQDYLGLQYYLAYEMPIVRVRPFNHIGPKQSPKFAISSFARQIAEIEKGKKEPVMRVGNLNTRKDFTDVRDVVRSYAFLAEYGEAGEPYNVGSGISHLMKDVLEKLLALSKTTIDIQVDPALFRPIETPDFVCDNRKLVQVTHWKPEITLDQSLKDTLDYWRNIS